MNENTKSVGAEKRGLSPILREASLMRRLLILILALGWGTLVFSIDAGHTFFALTVFAALPLFIGAFLVHAETGWRRFLRWVCMAFLVMQAMFLLGLTEFNPWGFLPFLGVYLLLPGPASSWRQWLHRGAILGFAVFGLTAFYQSAKQSISAIHSGGLFRTKSIWKPLSMKC